MTRINVGILPSELSGKHLLAEHREIKRIPNMIKNGRYSLIGQPKEFKLGQGHVKFFYDKLLYLKNRYIDIHKECLKRGYNVQNYLTAWEGLPTELFQDYHPTIKDIKLVHDRIKSKSK